MPSPLTKAELKKRVAATTPTPEVLPAEPIARGRLQAMAEASKVQETTTALSAAVATLTITDDDDYQAADQLLGRIRDARKMWGNVWTRIQEKTIKPIRAGLEELYSLNRDVDTPAERLEERVKTAMRVYKLDEQKRIADAQRARDAEEQRLLRLAEQKAEAETTAKTAAMRERLRLAREALEQQSIDVALQETPAPVVGTRSGTRTKRAWRLKSIEDFCVGVAEGTIPVDCITLVNVAINRYYKDNPELVESWPGMEGFDDIQIAGR